MLRNKLKNPGTIIGLTSAVIYILTQFGVSFAPEPIMNSVEAICFIGITLGVLNNPETDGIDNPFNSFKK